MNNLLHPVQRTAQFSKAAKGLNERQALEIANILRDNWEVNCDEIKKEIEKEFSGSKINILKEQESRVQAENDRAYVVDYPEFICDIENHIFKLRVITAVCFKDSSTKSWARVSLNGSSDLEDEKVLSKLKKRYTQLSSLASKINQRLFSDLLKLKLKVNPIALGDITITTFSINDEKLGKYLELFDNVNLGLIDLFTNGEEAEKIIKDYFTSLFNKKSLFPSTRNKNKEFWFTSPSGVFDEDGFLKESNVLYNIKLEGKSSIKAYGIGYDSTENGTLASLSSLKVARIYGRQI